jgi:integrase
METLTMARRRTDHLQPRGEWRKSEGGCWSRSLGERGRRVRVTQRRPGGEVYRIVGLPGRRQDRKSLGTTSRPAARELAEAFLRSLREAEAPPGQRPLTLGELWHRYQREAPGYRRNTDSTRRDKRARAALLLLGLGRRKPAADLTISEVERYAELRRRGTGWPDGRETAPVRSRSVQADLQLLRHMLNWATTVKNADGSWLLGENPLRGMRLSREHNPTRPRATYHRFQTLRGTVARLAREAKRDSSRLRWTRLELALVLAEATGRRIGAVAGLRWSDVDFEGCTIRWRAAFDKKRREQIRS